MDERKKTVKERERVRENRAREVIFCKLLRALTWNRSRAELHAHKMQRNEPRCIFRPGYIEISYII